MNKTFIYGIGNALVDSEYKVTDEELNQLNLQNFLDINEREFSQKLNPVYQAIEITKKKLNKEKSLIAFIGAPWTLITYMLNIKNNKNEICNKNNSCGTENRPFYWGDYDTYISNFYL